MPAPSPSHQRLERLLGVWRGEEQIHPGPFDPAGGSAVGRVTNRQGLDGFAVVQDHEQQRQGRVNFRGHGIFRFAPERNQYALYWFDSLGQPPAEFWGTFEGQVLTLVQYGPQGHLRAAWDLSREGGYSYRMEVSGDGAQWTPFMTGDYTRVTAR